MLSLQRKAAPLSYGHCNQTVTLYHQEGETYHRRVIQGAHLDFKKNSNIGKVGSHEVNSFLLVLTQGAGGQTYLPPVQYAAVGDKGTVYTVAANDKILLGVGGKITTPEQWRTFIPSHVDGLVVVKYIDVKYWQGEICHLEVGG